VSTSEVFGSFLVLYRMTWNGFQEFPHGKSNFSKKSNLKATDWDDEE
jgi:hypothetical protein